MKPKPPRGPFQLLDRAAEMRRRAEILRGASPHLFAAAMLGFMTIPQAEEALMRSAHPFEFPMGLFADADTGRISNDLGNIFAGMAGPKSKTGRRAS
jgi:hypothetical protein